jgi:adenylate cyclase
MFADIRDFSSYSEKQSPEDLTQFINNFLTPMTDIILDQQGTIDKYIGDCIMAFWNAPLDVADHAVRAARATLAMRAELVKFNERLEVFNTERGSHLSPVRIGMGLNTGICCVGNLGSRLRFNYSALGNAVDISSRLEGQSKLYGVDLVVGEATLVQLKGFAAIEIDLIRVKGKKQAVYIFTLLGDEVLAAHADFMKLSTLHSAMLQAYRAQQWHEASAALEEAVVLAKSLELVALAIPVPSLAGLYDLYRTRMVEYAQTPPPADWDGVYVATFK